MEGVKEGSKKGKGTRKGKTSSTYPASPIRERRDEKTKTKEKRTQGKGKEEQHRVENTKLRRFF